MPGRCEAACDGLVDLVRGKVASASCVMELNAALASVITAIEMEVDDGRLRAEFRLHVPDGEYGPFTLSRADDTDRMRRAYLEQQQPGGTPSSKAASSPTSLRPSDDGRRFCLRVPAQVQQPNRATPRLQPVAYS